MLAAVHLMQSSVEAVDHVSTVAGTSYIYARSPKEAFSWDEATRPSGRWLLGDQDERFARGNYAISHKKKAARNPVKVLKERPLTQEPVAFLLVRLPVVDSLRNQLTAPSEDILGTLAVMQDVVCT